MSIDDGAPADPDPVAMVETWRRRMEAAPDAVTWRIVEALARRAAAQRGEARRLLIVRIERRLSEASVPGRLACGGPDAAQPLAARRDGLAALSDLVERLGRTPTAREAPGVEASPPAAPASLKSVTAFKSTWSRLRADQRLRQARTEVPSMAGPLNSALLGNRTLQRLRELSPAYLEAFMLYVDALRWLEQASAAGHLAPGAAKAPDTARPRGAKASRKA